MPFDDVFALLTAVQLSADDLARLREWIAAIAHPDECNALIEQAARGRPCPRCACPRANALVVGVLDILAAVRLRESIAGEWRLALAGNGSVMFGAVVFALTGGTGHDRRVPPDRRMSPAR